MTTPFESSQTRINLMRAFAGESQARNRYTFAATMAEGNQLHVIAEAFRFTADQEKEHGEIFYDQLRGLDGETIVIDGGYPVNLAESVLGQLKSARHNEYEEYETVYPGFAKVARDEGFTRIGDIFANIAAIERTHGIRFDQFLTALTDGNLFLGDGHCAWLCLNCGHIHEGSAAPVTCPVCHHDQGFFIRNGLAPFVTRLC